MLSLRRDPIREKDSTREMGGFGSGSNSTSLDVRDPSGSTSRSDKRIESDPVVWVTSKISRRASEMTLIVTYQDHHGYLVPLSHLPRLTMSLKPDVYPFFDSIFPMTLRNSCGFLRRGYCGIRRAAARTHFT